MRFLVRRSTRARPVATPVCSGAAPAPAGPPPVPFPLARSHAWRRRGRGEAGPRRWPRLEPTAERAISDRAPGRRWPAAPRRGGGRWRWGLARQHAGQLDHPLLIVEETNVGHRAAVALVLGDRHLVVGEGRHLGQVGDDDDLMAVVPAVGVGTGTGIVGAGAVGAGAVGAGAGQAGHGAGQAGQGPAHGQGGLAADAGVDLVEHQGGWCVAQHQPAGEHGAGQFAAGGDLGQGQGRLARIGAEEEGHGRAGGVVGGIDHRHLEASAGQGQFP